MSYSMAYNSGSTAPRRYHSPEETSDRSLRVVKGSAKEVGLSSTILLLAKVIAVGLVVLTVLGFLRIALNSATIATAVESRELSASVDNARSEASTLELQQSALASPDRIKSAASAFGMIAPYNTQILNLKPDCLVLDESGAISLSGSTQAVAQSALL